MADAEEETIIQVGTTCIRVSAISAYGEDAAGNLWIETLAGGDPYIFSGYTVAQFQVAVRHLVKEVV